MLLAKYNPDNIFLGNLSVVGFLLIIIVLFVLTIILGEEIREVIKRLNNENNDEDENKVNLKLTGNNGHLNDKTK